MSSELTEIFMRLRPLSRHAPLPSRLPTEADVSVAEQRLGVSFPPDFRRYLLEASNVAFGTFEPVTLKSGSHTDLVTVTEDGRKYWRLPADYIPICEANVDLYCVTPSGEVVFWPHDGTSDEKWPNVASWIENVWIGESRQ